MRIALLAACTVIAPASLAPERADRSADAIDLGRPGPGTVHVTAFAISERGDWSVVGALADPVTAETRRWTLGVSADGEVRHTLHGPGWLMAVDHDDEGRPWATGFGAGGKPWVARLGADGAPLDEVVYEGPVGGELWAIEGVGDGAVALGMQVPASLGNAHALWLEVGPGGARTEKLGRGIAYAYANDLAIAPDGTAVAVGAEAHRARWYTVEGDHLEGHTVLPDVLSGLDRVAWTPGGWLAAGGVATGQIGLFRFAGDAAPVQVAVSSVQGPAGDAASLHVHGEDVWLHGIEVHGRRFEAWSHRIFRKEGDALVQVGPDHRGWGALALDGAGIPWRAWADADGVHVERVAR